MSPLVSRSSGQRLPTPGRTAPASSSWATSVSPPYAVPVLTSALNCTGAFYQAPFPQLVRDLPAVKQSESDVLAGTKDHEAHAELDMLERSKISNYSLAFSAIGSAACIAISLGISIGIGTDTVAANTKVYSVIIAFFGGIWVISSVPWFVCEQYRPGQKLPDGTGWLLAGPKQVWSAAKALPQLKQTFLYLIAYFLLADVYNTSGAVVNILQNNAIEFDATEFSGLFLVVYGTEFIGIMAANMIQQRWKIRAKTMLMFAWVCIVFTTLWGFAGVWTNNIGYHNVWEFWWFQAWLGLLTGGWFSYGQTIMAEVSPAPKMYLFMSLYNTVGVSDPLVAARPR